MCNYKKEQIDAAQKILNALCKEHKIKPFRIDRRQGGDWKKLVKSMCGLIPPKAKKGGRPKKYTDEQVLYAVQQIDIMSSFGKVDCNGDAIEKALMTKIAWHEAAKKLSKILGDEITDDAARGLWNRYSQITTEELSKEPPDF